MSGLDPIAAPQTLASHARAAVLAAIGDGRLEPGTLHSVAQLAEQLGVSRTPVREALLMLEREGRVRFERNRGVRITVPTAHDIAEVFELRLLLEVPAAAKACGAVDTGALQAALDEGDGERFHEEILLAAGNRRLAAIVAGLREVLAGPRRARRGRGRCRAPRDPRRARGRRRRPRGRGDALPPAPHRRAARSYPGVIGVV